MILMKEQKEVKFLVNMTIQKNKKKLLFIPTA